MLFRVLVLHLAEEKSMSFEVPALKKLKQGVRRFQTEVYPKHSEEYQYAATHKQEPHTLIITCSDSRIDIESVTSSKPGEIFVARNVGNIVPEYGNSGESIAAVVEYAVNALKVQQVVVCGHSDCGAMKALQAGGKPDGLPAVTGWLKQGASAGESSPELPHLTEQNVLLQLEHLKTHPAVAQAHSRGELTLSGWVYDIATGDVRIHNAETGTFEPTLNQEAATA